MLNLWICSGIATWSALVKVLYSSDDINEKKVAEDIKENPELNWKILQCLRVILGPVGQSTHPLF